MKRILQMVCLLVAAALLIYCAVGVAYEAILAKRNQQLYPSVRTEFSNLNYNTADSDAESGTGSDSPAETPVKVSAAAEENSSNSKTSFTELRNAYPNIVAWVRIPNTCIDYPVLQASESDPQYYLEHDYTGAVNKYGSIVLDAGCTIKSTNLLIYGHHMRDGQMFAALPSLAGLSAYRRSPVVTLETAAGTSEWKIVSVFKTNTEPSQGTVFNYLRREFLTEPDFLNFAYQERIRSIINTGVDVKSGDRLLTLSTCSYEFDNFRTVVVARQLRTGEDLSVDTSAAALNRDVLYPACWYKKYGGSAPVWPETYEEARAEGVI